MDFGSAVGAHLLLAGLITPAVSSEVAPRVRLPEIEVSEIELELLLLTSLLRRSLLQPPLLPLLLLLITTFTLPLFLALEVLIPLLLAASLVSSATFGLVCCSRSSR